MSLETLLDTEHACTTFRAIVLLSFVGSQLPARIKGCSTGTTEIWLYSDVCVVMPFIVGTAPEAFLTFDPLARKANNWMIWCMSFLF